VKMQVFTPLFMLKNKRMNTAMLNKYIQTLVPMPADKVQLIAAGFEWVEISKNEFLIKENKLSKETYFLESGIVRSFTFDNNGEEITTNIFSAPCFVNDFLSFFRQEPAKENFQTLTICKIWKMDYANVQTHFHTYPEFREFGRMMLVSNYAALHARMLGMIKDSAETRYLKLMQQQPDIFQNVSLKIIASYLGITDTSLSRIRREITHK
jgi:CRP-like cAMP-binding protein